MKPYDSRDVTLDPGLTLLALRGLRQRGGHYPFIDSWRRRRETLSRAEAGGAAWKALVRSLVPTSLW